MTNSTLSFDFNLAEHLLGISHMAEDIAFTYGDTPLSRGQLTRKVEGMATLLRRAGATESDRILLLMLDTPAFVVTFMASMAIGAIPVPLNPKTSPEVLRHIMLDSRARYAVVELDNLDLHVPVLRESPYIQPDGLLVQVHDHHGESVPREPLEEQRLAPLPLEAEHAADDFTGYCIKKPQSIAFWQYSSGTTGRPKAIEHSQIGMLENCELFAKRTIGIHADDRIYSIPKMFFGYGLGNSFFFPLVLGGQALIDAHWPTPKRVLDNLRRYRPTVFFGVPAMYNALLDPSMGVTDEDLASVRLFFSAGSPLPEQLYERWRSRFGRPILDGIGATEVGHVFLTNTPHNSRPGSTGTPVEAYQVRLMTEEGREAAVGEQGVLLVKGPSLCCGYWENPGLNNDKFRDGWYRTGDVFVRDEHGHYRCKGREDDLFKVNGRWVVPIEVESEVQRHFPEVKEAVLVGREGGSGMTEPVLFVNAAVEAHAHAALKDAILDRLATSVESHKRPRACFILDEFPRNDNGKLMRGRLSEQARQALDASATNEALAS